MRNSFFDVGVMIFSGVIGLIFRRWDFPVAPLIIGVVLGPMTEVNLRKTLVMFDGSLLPLFQRPIAAVFLVSSLAAIAFMVWRAWRGKALRRPE